MLSMDFLQLSLGLKHSGSWEGFQRFQVHLWIDTHPTPLRREQDQLLHDMFRTTGYDSDQLWCLNWVWIRLQALFLSNITTANGRSIKPINLNDRAPKVNRSKYHWPKERPTPANFQLWRQAITCITGPVLYLHDSLGPWRIAPTHQVWNWRWSPADNVIIHLKPSGINYFSLQGGCKRSQQTYRHTRISDEAAVTSWLYPLFSKTTSPRSCSIYQWGSTPADSLWSHSVILGLPPHVRWCMDVGTPRGQ